MQLELPPVVVLDLVRLGQVPRVKLARLGRRRRRRRRRRRSRCTAVVDRDPLDLADPVEHSLEQLLVDPGSEWRNQDQTPTVIRSRLEVKKHFC